MERVCFLLVWVAVLFVPNAGASNLPAVPVTSEQFSLFEENGKVGLKDQEGHVLIPASYDAIGWSNGKFSIVDRVVGYQSSGLWGLIHTSNRVVTPAEFSELMPGEGSFLIARKRSSLSQRLMSGVINTSGKTVLPFDYDALTLSSMRAIVTMRSGMRYAVGLVDLDHSILIPASYRRLYPLGSLRYAVENFDRKTAIFSDEGSQLTDFVIDSISTFKKDFAVVYQHHRQGLIDRNGRMVLSPTYGEILPGDDGTVRVRDVATWFFLDGENNLKRKFEADEVWPLSPEHYAVLSGGKVQLMDNSFNALAPESFSSLSEFRDGLALYRRSGKTGVVNLDGKIVVPAQYDEIVMDGDHFLASLERGPGNRWVILDEEGRTLTEKQYEAIAPFSDRIYAVRNRGYWGAVNASGKQTIACVHDSLLEQRGNQVAVKFKGQYGIIDIHERWLATPRENRVGLLNDQRYFEYDGETTFIKSFEGDIIYFSENPLTYNGKYIREDLPSGAHWLIDLSGIIIDRSHQPHDADKIFVESEGLRAIYKDGKYGFIDEQGRLRVANRYEDVRPFSEGIAAIRILNRWGFIDRHERLVVQPVYDNVGEFNDGLAIVSQNNVWGVIDSNGKVVLPLRYDMITLNAQNRYLLRQGHLYGLADEDGAVIIHPRYDALTDTGGGYVIVEREGKSGVVTLHGVSTIPMIYDSVSFDRYHNQFMALKRSPWKTIDNPKAFLSSEP